MVPGTGGGWDRLMLTTATALTQLLWLPGENSKWPLDPTQGDQDPKQDPHALLLLKLEAVCWGEAATRDLSHLRDKVVESGFPCSGFVFFIFVYISVLPVCLHACSTWSDQKVASGPLEFTVGWNNHVGAGIRI